MADSVFDYHGFLSYRVNADKDLTEKLYLRLTGCELNIFWDKECLEPGAPWESGFTQGLLKSNRVIAIISEKSLEGIAESAHGGHLAS